MWTVVYIASGNRTAEYLKDLLVKEGLLVNLRAAGTSSKSGEPPVEILVPETEAEEAYEILNKVLVG